MTWLDAEIPAWFAASVAAIGGVAFGLRKLYMAWGRDGVAIAETSAKKTIVEQLHDELTRMSAQNLALAGELNKLQLHILELTKQIGSLTSKNTQLEHEINHLRDEISRFRAATDIVSQTPGSLSVQFVPSSTEGSK